MDWNRPRSEIGDETPLQYLKRNEDNYNAQTMAELLSEHLNETVTRDAVRHALGRYPETPLPKADASFDTQFALYSKMIGRSLNKPLPKKLPEMGKHRKVVVVCDTHGDPNPAVVSKVVAEGAELTVFNGDNLNAAQFSKFPKDGVVPVLTEVARVRAFAELLNRVKFTNGNHDDRVKKYFENRIDSEFMQFVRWNLTELITFGLPNAEVANNLYDFATTTGHVQKAALKNLFIAHEGDVLIAHAEASRKEEGRTVDMVAKWVELWRKPLGWKEPRLIIQAHVHRADIIYAQGGHQVRVEGGYAGNIADLQYTHNYGAVMYTPPVLGYTVFEQGKDVDGEWLTDLSTVRFILC